MRPNHDLHVNMIDPRTCSAALPLTCQLGQNTGVRAVDVNKPPAGKIASPSPEVFSAQQEKRRTTEYFSQLT
jgi:hypothetical protein